MFEYSYGSVRGKEHLKLQKNNQDAFNFIVTPDVTVGVVCDGCGSGEKTEVGASLGSKLLTQAIIQEHSYLINSPNWGTEAADTSIWWNRVLKRFLARIDPLIYDMGGSVLYNVNNYFLFTTFVVLIDKDMAIFASIGDGVVIVNDEIIQVGPFEGNQPPYPVYNISPRKDISTLNFTVHKVLPINELNSFLIGCDGVRDFINIENELIPGTLEPVGNINQFWTNDRFFKNPSLLTGRLTKINGGLFHKVEGKLAIQNGLLPDDTTLIVGRKKVNIND